VDKTRTSKILVSIPAFELPASEFEAIKVAANTDDPLPKIQSWVKWFLSNYASGGLMLSGSEVRQVEKSTGQQLANGREVVAALLKAGGMEEGLHTFRVQLDPVWIAPAKETAAAQGVELEHLISDALNSMLGNGWLYEWVLNGGTARFTKEEWDGIKALTGKAIPTGADIFAELGKAAVGERK
jgi:hypothetical protein